MCSFLLNKQDTTMHNFNVALKKKDLDTLVNEIRPQIKNQWALWRGHTELYVCERPFIQCEHP